MRSVRYALQASIFILNNASLFARVSSILDLSYAKNRAEMLGDTPRVGQMHIEIRSDNH